LTCWTSGLRNIKKGGWIKISLIIPNWNFPFLNYSLDSIISLLTSYWHNKWRKITCENVKTTKSKRDKGRENAKPDLSWFGHNPCLYSVPKQSAWDFHYPCKILYKQWTTKESPPLCSVITTKKLCPLLAMNPKAVSLLSPMITTKKLYPLLAMNPKAG